MLDPMKLGILVCGIAGLASAFVGADGAWSMRGAMPAAVYAYVFGFALAAGIAAWKLARPPLLRHHAIVALIGTALSLMVYRGSLGDLLRLAPIVKDHSASSILYAIGLYGGIIFGIGAIAKPEKYRG